MQKNRIVYLDGLRGLLAFIVFIHHYLFCFAPGYLIGGVSPADAASEVFTKYKLIAYTPLNVFLNAGFAVGFFFVLSGYVLSYQYFLNPTLRLLQRNVLKRYFRLAIPVLASCLLIWVLHRLNCFDKSYLQLTDVNKDWVGRVFSADYSFWYVLKHGACDVFLNNTSKYNDVLWTMGIELIGSFLVFGALMLTHKLKNKGAIFLAILLLQFLLWENGMRANIIKFTFGMSICYLQFNSGMFVKIGQSIYTKIALFIIGIYAASFPYVTYEGALQKTIYKPIAFFLTRDYYTLINTIACCCLLIVFINSNLLKKIFSTKLFQFLGNISFGLYLIHLILIFTLSTNLYRIFYGKLYDYVNIPLTFVISTAVLLGVSFLFYKFIDLFALKNASRISKFILRQ